MAKVRIELRDRATDLLKKLAEKMDIPLAAANNALVMRYAPHAIDTYQHTGTEPQTFMPITTAQSQTNTPEMEKIDISTLMEPMEI
jgi:hypothetical protein